MQRLSGVILILVGVAALVAAPFVFYPLFLIKLLCFALFACAFNLLAGTVGILSFGHAAFYGSAAYIEPWTWFTALRGTRVGNGYTDHAQ